MLTKTEEDQVLAIFRIVLIWYQDAKIPNDILGTKFGIFAAGTHLANVFFYTNCVSPS